MDEQRPSHDWDVKICPLRNKQCLAEQCAWWLKDAGCCAVTQIALLQKKSSQE